MKKKLIELLQKWLGKLLSEYNDLEQSNRLESVRSFLHETLPAINPEFSTKTIIEGGKYNYFELPSGDIPTFDFVLPEVPLYICVLNITSASWEEARNRGVSRGKWELAQADLAVLKKKTEELATRGSAIAPKILILSWGDSVNHHELLRILDSLCSGETE